MKEPACGAWSAGGHEEIPGLRQFPEGCWRLCGHFAQIGHDLGLPALGRKFGAEGVDRSGWNQAALGAGTDKGAVAGIR
jgi:hypothetical protein